MKNLDDFYATYYSFIVRFIGKCFPKLSELSSEQVRLGKFIINAKKENQFEDAVFDQNLSLEKFQYCNILEAMSFITFTKNFKVKKM